MGKKKKKKTGLPYRVVTMSFIDFETGGLRRGLVLPLIGLGWVPKHGVVHRRNVQILSDSKDPCGQAIDPGAIRLDHGDLQYIKPSKAEG